MFVNETVFVIGAGASWHYGYPTGERLVSEVVDLAKRYRNYCSARLRAGVNVDDMPLHLLARSTKPTIDGFVTTWHQEVALCSELIDSLVQMEPLVIDYFLGWNPDLHDLGRMIIAGCLLERQTLGAPDKNVDRGGVAGNDNWIRFITHELLIGVSESSDLRKNRVHFVTFNYDRSLEVRIGKALRAAQILK